MEKEMIAIHDCDKTDFPNLALMKICAYWRQQGIKIGWYFRHLHEQYEAIYSSKVFTYTDLPGYSYDDKFICGGYGYRMDVQLPDDVEHTCPDYEFFRLNRSYGFTTRGCPRKCEWCVVPIKEGAIRAHAEVKEFLRHDELILMDNNILAHEHGIKQLEWLTTQRVRVDINAGLDARLIKETEAKLLAKLMWLEPPRMACDRVTHLNTVCHAIETMRWYNVEPRRYFVYVLVKKETFDEALHIVRVLKGYDVDIYVSPYRAIDGTVDITPDMADLARWANRRAICKSIPWEDYSSGVRGKSQFKKRRRLYRREK